MAEQIVCMQTGATREAATHCAYLIKPGEKVYHQDTMYGWANETTQESAGILIYLKKEVVAGHHLDPHPDDPLARALYDERIVNVPRDPMSDLLESEGAKIESLQTLWARERAESEARIGQVVAAIKELIASQQQTAVPSLPARASR